ncbi:hypothetical protein GCK32_018209 [Trichostrongylus colubriformis]|uniref:TIL domain-containing protein n=1 Tax=Trichostrongylus colubriformis TaxID=6319 RepID=A0AAN8FJC2_TRICO
MAAFRAAPMAPPLHLQDASEPTTDVRCSSLSSRVHTREMQRTVYIIMLTGIVIALVNAEEKCGPNEEYYDCVPDRGTCNVSGYRITSCLRGCWCKKGYKRASRDDKTCVPVGPSCK